MKTVAGKENRATQQRTGSRLKSDQISSRSTVNRFDRQQVEHVRFKIKELLDEGASCWKNVVVHTVNGCFQVVFLMLKKKEKK